MNALLPLALFLFLAAMPHVAAAGWLDAPFGVPLGAPCAFCGGLALETADSGGLMTYRITPPFPDPRLEVYQLRVCSSGKHKGDVLDVSGLSVFTKQSDAEAAFAALHAALSEALGPTKTRDNYRAKICEYAPRGSKRVLTLLLRQDLVASRWVLFVNVMDRELFAKERAGQKKK